MTTIILTAVKLESPVWSKAEAIPGEEIELSVQAELVVDQEIEFRIRDRDTKYTLGVVKPNPGEKKATWVTPNLPGETTLQFDAILREKPGPKNGHLGVLCCEESGQLTLKGFKVAVTDIDAAFVPKQEKLEVKYKVEDPKGTAQKGRIEIWGERYPTNKPLYAEDFVPADGDQTWNTWHGGKNPNNDTGKITEEPLKDKYLTPEFSPYRLRMIVGPDDEAIQDPFGKGLGKVSIAERQFEVKVESIQIRVMSGLTEAIAADHTKRKYKLDNVLMIEPRAADGTYDDAGRLPCLSAWQTSFLVAQDGDREYDVSTLKYTYKVGANELALWLNNTKLPSTDYEEVGAADTLSSKIKLKENLSKKDDRLWIMRHIPASTADQTGRIRIPMARFALKTEELDMAAHNERVADGYLHGSAVNKYTVDKAIYTRPELPIEFVLLLTSKHTAKNAAPYGGLFEPEAIGPAKIEPVAEDNYLNTLYTTGPAQHRTYFKNAHFKIKRGTDTVPYNDGADPVFTYWQWRKALATDVNADTPYDFSAFDAGMKYTVGADELTVWLNRTLLTKDVGYEEDPGGGTSSTITLKKGIAKAKDVLWVVRSDPTATAPNKVDGWKRNPPGTNCHEHYGGLRGKDPSVAVNRLFLKDFSAAPGGTEPIIGKSSDPYPWKDKEFINLKPDPITLTLDKQERVEVTALLTGDKQGLAGVIFSPSYIGADSYVLKARLEPYERSFGEVLQKPQKEAKTGAMTVWRWMQMEKSLRMPTQNTRTLPSGVGSNAEQAVAARTYKANGKNMDMDDMNTNMLNHAFNEWTVPPLIPITAATKEKPIKITTAVSHGFSMGQEVKITGVEGNTAANGTHTITKVDDTNLKLNGVEGTEAYTKGGSVEPVEFHTDINLSEYIVAHDGVGGLGAGQVTIGGPRAFPIVKATKATPIVITTACAHWLENGERVVIAGVGGNTDANGTFIITRNSDTKFTLNGSVGNADYTSGGTATFAPFPPPVKVSGATKANPVEITTATAHKLATGDRVVVKHILGKTKANGMHTITRVSDTKFTLNGVVGDADYTSGGEVIHTSIAISKATKDEPIKIETLGPHKLRTGERVTVADVGGNTAANGDSTVTVVSGTEFTLDGKKGKAGYIAGGTVLTQDTWHRNIRDEVGQYDTYRFRLPKTILINGADLEPEANANLKRIASFIINTRVPRGARWEEVIPLIQTEYNAMSPKPSDGYATLIPETPAGWSEEDYFWTAHGQWMLLAQGLMDHFTPPENVQPRVMNIIRWQRLHDWTISDITWQGQCFGSGQSMIHSEPNETTLFSHEMGHATHLVHLLGGNFGWKHHDLNFPQCMMSYGHIEANIYKPIGGVGIDGNAFSDGGWPEFDNAGDYGVWFDALDDLGTALAEPCARCMLKLQGWKEDVLPVTWNNPDLF